MAKNSVGKQELVDKIKERVGGYITKKEVEEVLEAFEKVVTELLKEGKKIRLRNFLKMETKEKRIRGYDFKRKKVVEKGKKRVIKIKPGKKLKKEVEEG